MALVAGRMVPAAAKRALVAAQRAWEVAERARAGAQTGLAVG